MGKCTCKYYPFCNPVKTSYALLLSDAVFQMCYLSLSEQYGNAGFLDDGNLKMDFRFYEHPYILTNN